jgi:hypothetical protein
MAERDFWRASGYGLLSRNDAGELTVTDAFLRAYLRRPEMQPVEESCTAEIALHEALVDDPRLAVGADRIASLADSDGRDNYRFWTAFRDRLVAAGTVERCYIELFTNGGGIAILPLFIDQMAHVIARNILDGCDNPMRARAAELLFRSQKVTLDNGPILLADEETVEMHAQTSGFGNIGRLLAQSRTPARSIDLDVLSDANADIYWQRDDRYDTVLDATFGRAGLTALCAVLVDWVRHFRGIDVTIEPVGMIRDDHWVWHVGLDTESSAILNDLYAGDDIEEPRMARLLSLFRLEFRDPAAMRLDVAGRPVYLGMAMTEDNVLRLKPQNLLVNLPLAETA